MIESVTRLAPRNKAGGIDQPPPIPSAEDSTESTTRRIRLLVPIDATEESRWGIRYALHRHEEGEKIEVILLNIGEPVTQWQVLRFRTQQEVAEFQSERAQFFIEDASSPLEYAHVPYQGLFKQGALVFTILDAAEELECDEIVMPEPPSGIAGFFSHGIVSTVLKQQRDVPVVVVNSQGLPVE